MAQKKTKKVGKKKKAPTRRQVEATRTKAKRAAKKAAPEPQSERAPKSRRPKGSEPVHRLARNPNFPHDATVDEVPVPGAEVDRRKG